MAVTKVGLANHPQYPGKPPINEFLQAYTLLNAPIVAASADGSAVLTQYDTPQDIRIIVQSGPVSGTSPTLDVLIQESSTGSSGWVTIATIPQIIAANYVYNEVVTKTKKYIRYSHTLGGSMTPKVSVNILVLE